MSENEPPAAANTTETLRTTAQEAHYELCKHYSDLIFKGRVSLITLTVIVVAFVFGIVPDRKQPLPAIAGLDPRGLLAFVSSVVVCLLNLMEMGYIKRFYQVIASGRAIEQGRLPSYFDRFDRAESWPLHFAYGLGIFVLAASFVALNWLPGELIARTVALITIASIPMALFLWSQWRLTRTIKAILPDKSAKGSSECD